MRKIAEGAEADIYEDTVLGIAAVLKKRRVKRYIEPALEKDLRLQRTKAEARIMGAANMMGLNVPALLAAGADTIFMSRVAGKPLHGLPRQAMDRAMNDAGEILGRLHSVGIAHGDFTPANMLVDASGALWLIDFGLAAQHASREDLATDVLLLKRSVSAREYSAFLKSYSKWGGSSEVLRKLASMERRGRYQTRSLETR